MWQASGEGSCGGGAASGFFGPPPLVRRAERGGTSWLLCHASGGGSSEFAADSDSREGMESVSEGGGVTRRGDLCSTDRGMVSMVLNAFRRSW